MNAGIIRNKNSFNIAEIALVIIACFAVYAPSLKKILIVDLRQVVTLPFKMDVILFYVGFAFIFIFAIPILVNRIRIDSFIIVALLAVFVSYAFLVGREYWGMYLIICKQMVGAILLFCIVRCVRDFAMMKRCLGYSAIIITLAELLNILISNNVLTFGTGAEARDQMASYTLLLATVISFSFMFDKVKNLVQAINGIVATLLMFAMGARGPIVCLVLFFATRLIIAFRDDIKRIIPIGIAALFAILVITFFYTPILEGLMKIFGELGLSTRSIQSLLDKTFFSDSARIGIYQESWQVIKDNAFFGIGLFKDRVLLGNYIGVFENEEMLGWYPHNILIEIMMQFGLIFGVLIIIAIFTLFLNAIFRCKNKDLVSIVCMLAAVGFYPLFISFSYISNNLFYMFIALCITAWCVTRELGVKLKNEKTLQRLMGSIPK